MNQKAVMACLPLLISILVSDPMSNATFCVRAFVDSVYRSYRLCAAPDLRNKSFRLC